MEMLHRMFLKLHAANVLKLHRMFLKLHRMFVKLRLALSVNDAITERSIDCVPLSTSPLL